MDDEFNFDNKQVITFQQWLDDEIPQEEFPPGMKSDIGVYTLLDRIADDDLMKIQEFHSSCFFGLVDFAVAAHFALVTMHVSDPVDIREAVTHEIEEIMKKIERIDRRILGKARKREYGASGLTAEYCKTIKEWEKYKRPSQAENPKLYNKMTELLVYVIHNNDLFYARWNIELKRRLESYLESINQTTGKSGEKSAGTKPKYNDQIHFAAAHYAANKHKLDFKSKSMTARAEAIRDVIREKIKDDSSLFKETKVISNKRLRERLDLT